MPQADNPILVTVTRGPIVENRHRAAVAVVDASGDLVEAWGDIESAVLPRSSVKILQALPLVESGAAQRFRLDSEHLALACASHQGAPLHTGLVSAWLAGLELDEGALLCGPQPPRDRALREANTPASRIMNNCSGKHTGFLTTSLHLGLAPAHYLAPGEGLQAQIAEVFAEMTDTTLPLSYGIDGCSAPNFAASLRGLALSMARLANPASLGPVRAAAAARLVEAMRLHPLLMSGEGRACAALIEACEGRAVVKTGADGVFTGILPARGLGFCLKVDDGQTQAAEALCAGLLARYGALDLASPTYARYAATPITNFNHQVVGARQVHLAA